MVEYHPDLLMHNPIQFLLHRLPIFKTASLPCQAHSHIQCQLCRERVVNRLLNISSSNVYYQTDKTAEGTEHNLMCECSLILITIIPQP